MLDDPKPVLAEQLYQKLAELETNIRRDQATAKKIRELLGLLLRRRHLPPVAVDATSRILLAVEQRAPTKKAAIRDAIREELGKHPSMHRTAILQHLKDQGLMGTERDPMRSLAIYLTEFDEVESLGEGEWRLKPPSVGAG